MKHLFKVLFFNRKHHFLLALSIISMAFLTFASQSEMLTLGIITKQGPDFFELFAPSRNDILKKVDFVSKKEVRKSFLYYYH